MSVTLQSLDKISQACDYVAKSEYCEYFRKWEVRDKFFRLVSASLSMLSYHLESSQVSQETKAGIHATVQSIDGARIFLGIFNVFAGIIPSIIVSVRSLKESLSSLFQADQTKELVINAGGIRVYESWKEKWLAVGYSASGGIASLGALLGFGVCRPITFIDRNFPNQLAPSTKRIGQQFLPVMMLFFCGRAVSCMLDSLHIFFYSFRKTEAPQSFFSGLDTELPEDVKLEKWRTVLAHRFINNFIEIFEQGAEVALVTALVFVKKTPKPVALFCNIIIPLFALVRVWRVVKTEVASKNETFEKSKMKTS